MIKVNKNATSISINNKTNKYLVLDTETIHSGKLLKDSVINIRDIIEISWKILDCDGVEIIGSRKGFVVKEFWENKPYLLSDNYEQDTKSKKITSKKNFAINKIVKWEQALANGTLKVASWGAIMRALNYDLKHYQVTLFTAYNIAFDRGAIACTSKMMPYYNYTKLWQIDYLDIMELVKVIAKDKNFKEWSINHKSFTNKGHYKTSAEAVYRYLTNNSNLLETAIPDSTSWSETHLAIEDIDCEATIVQGALALARRKRDIKVNINCYGGWSSLNKIIKQTKIKKHSKQLQLDIQEN